MGSFYRLILFFCVFLFLSSCSTLSSSKDKENAELYLKLGTSQLQDGAYPQALTSLLKAQALDDSNPFIHNNLALVYLMRDRLELAEKHLRKALSLKEDYSDARNNLGKVLIDMDKNQEAIKVLTIVTNDLTYESPEKPLTNLGIAFFNLKQFERSRDYLNKALTVQRENCLAQSYLGRSLFESEQYARAANSLDKAVGFCQSVQFDEPHYYSALAYLKSGDRPRAEARFEEVIKLYSNGKYADKARTLLETIRK
jgi:type IV pilus assembly protein PilF